MAFYACLLVVALATVAVNAAIPEKSAFETLLFAQKACMQAKYQITDVQWDELEMSNSSRICDFYSLLPTLLVAGVNTTVACVNFPEEQLNTMYEGNDCKCLSYVNRESLLVADLYMKGEACITGCLPTMVGNNMFAAKSGNKTELCRLFTKYTDRLQFCTKHTLPSACVGTFGVAVDVEYGVEEYVNAKLMADECGTCGVIPPL